MNTSVIKFSAGIGLFIVAGILGFSLFPETSDRISSNVHKTETAQAFSVDKPIKATPIQETEAAEPTPPAIAETASEAIAKTKPAENVILKYKGWTAEDNNGSTQACLSFDASFSATKESDLRPFFDVTPTTPFSLDALGNRICLLGLDYGQTYGVSAKSGLTADNGAELVRTRRVSVVFEDKPAFVGFASDGIILPETKGARVVLKTVNVDRLDLSLFRVNDRILSQHTPDIGDSGTADNYVSTYAASGRRVEIWSGEIDIKTDRNGIVETPFDLQDKITDQGPGAYILIAKNAEEGQSSYRTAKALRWLISTDLALTSYRGSDALHVAVRSIKAAQLQPGIRLDLIAANNDQLAEVITDSQGRAIFDNAILSGTGPMKPRMIMAYGPNGDYAVLDLSRAPLDLSMMDVQGRNVAGSFDLFAFTDRGIYRPGQSIKLTALLRDSDARAIEGRALTLTLKRPDGAEEMKVTLTDEEAGGYVTSIDLPSQAARGKWTIGLQVEGTETKIVETVSVEDFVPQKLKLTIKPEEHAVLKSGDVRDITLDAQFYYGAPGSNLETEGEVRIQRDPNPFPKFKDYRFGDLTEDFSERLVDIRVPLTNDDGLSEIKLQLDKSETASSHPLRASFIAGVAEPGGRFVRENKFIPVRELDTYIGFKSGFGERAERRKPAPIEIIALDRDGNLKGSKIQWTLHKEQRDYSWYRYRGRWQYRNQTRDVHEAEGEISIGNKTAAIWSKSLNWGRYRLDVKTETGETASFRFGVGWSNWGESDSDAPDRILVGATDLPTKPGGAMTLNLKAPYAGRGDIVIADHTVRSIRTVEIPEGASSVRIPYDPAWGHDVYAMVTLYTSLDPEKRQSVKRAVGLTHIGLDRSGQTLNVEINTPARVSPRTTLEVPIELTGSTSGEKAWVSVAAVDEGILALTKFKSPDATKAYFAKKAFSLDIRDDYSRILNPYLANGPTRSGGDSIGGAGLSVVPTKTVALFQGPVRIKNGKAVAKFELPDFNGELRIMATAWSDKAIGSASTSLKVRDAVPANLALPRFLAPGDSAVATLSLDNIDGAEGTYKTVTSGEGLLEAQTTAFDLPMGTRDQAGLNIQAADMGVFNLQTKISGPKNYSVTSSYPIEVRSPFRPVTRRSIKALEPGETYEMDADLLKDYSVAGGDIDVSVARLPGISATPYLAALNRYPYGCTEQTVSKAMPLLFVETLGGFKDTNNTQLKSRIDDAIQRVTSRQSITGEFGLWAQGDGYLAPWLQLYVSEFLIEADRNGFDVPDHSLESAIAAAQTLSKMERSSSLNLAFPNTESRKAADLERAGRAAYAHYVLALVDKPDASGVRYIDKAFGDKFEDSVTQTYLGAALARIGDADRAKAAFKRAYDQIGKEKQYRYYGSATRETAALLAIGSDALSDDVAEKALLGLTDIDPAETSTQERSYIIRAIAKLGAGQEDVKVSAKNVSLFNNSASILGTDLKRNPTISNKGNSRAYVTVDVTSTPKTAPEVLEAGFEVEKTLLTMRGKPVSTITVEQGERFIILLEAESKFTASTMVVIADLLPAGFEIETLLNPDDAGDEGAYKFLGELSDFDMQEARDDRFIASDRRNRWDRDRNNFRAAYVVRAVTTGDFVFPGVVIEDMYRPARVATSPTTELQVTPAGAL